MLMGLTQYRELSFMLYVNREHIHWRHQPCSSKHPPHGAEPMQVWGCGRHKGHGWDAGHVLDVLNGKGLSAASGRAQPTLY